MSEESPPPFDSDEPSLVRRAKEGDFEAFATLVRRHQQKIYALALGMVKNRAEAEEITQETFLSAFRKLSGFREQSRFSTWIYRVAVNHALMRLRKKKAVPAGDLRDLETRVAEFSEQVLPHWAQSQTDLLRNRAVAQALDEALGQLPPADRAILLLRVVNQLSYKEISNILGVSVAATKSRLHRARLQLREIFDLRLSENPFA
jgi:RNA polymerase sigma-70 factor, ECF subfamily